MDTEKTPNTSEYSRGKKIQELLDELMERMETVALLREQLVATKEKLEAAQETIAELRYQVKQLEKT